MQVNMLLLVQIVICMWSMWQGEQAFNDLPHMPISGSSNSAADKDLKSKIWINGEDR